MLLIIQAEIIRLFQKRNRDESRHDLGQGQCRVQIKIKTSICVYPSKFTKCSVNVL